MCQNYAKCELRKINDLERKAAIAEKEYLRLKESAESLSSPISGNGSSGCQPSDKIGNSVPAYVDAEKLKDALKRDAEKHRSKCLSLIHRLSKIIYTDILYARYFEHKKVSVIAKEQNYSDRHINNLRNEALDELNEILKGEIDDVPG